MVIKHLDVLRDLIDGLLAGLESAWVDEFGFQGSSIAFHGGIVLTVAKPRHRRADTPLAQQVLIGEGAILATPIRMMESPWRRMPGLKRTL